MQDSDIVPIEDQTMTIPKDHFVCGCDLDDENPYCIITPKDEYAVEYEKRVPIPKSLAYYLRTHFCGSHKMRDILFKQGQSQVRDQIKEALGLDEHT